VFVISSLSAASRRTYFTNRLLFSNNFQHVSLPLFLVIREIELTALLRFSNYTDYILCFRIPTNQMLVK
jgi:hypothetical protein